MSDLFEEIERIREYLNGQGDFYYSIGNVFVKLENSHIGKCDPTVKDYLRAVEDFWRMEGTCCALDVNTGPDF